MVTKLQINGQVHPFDLSGLVNLTPATFSHKVVHLDHGDNMSRYDGTIQWHNLDVVITI